MFCRSPVVCASDVSTFVFISVYTLLLSFLLPLSIIPNKFIGCFNQFLEKYIHEHTLPSKLGRYLT